MSWSHQPLVKVRKQVGWHAAPVHWCSDSLFLSLISIFTAACFGPASVTDDHSTQCSCPADVVPLRPQTCLFCSQFILPSTLSIAMRKREKQAVEVWDCVTPAFTDAPKQNQWRWFGSVKYLVLRKFILSYYLYDYNLQHCLSSFAHFIHQSEY